MNPVLATMSGDDESVVFRLPDDTFGKIYRVPGPAVWLGQVTRDGYTLRVGGVRLHLNHDADLAAGGGFVLRRRADGLGADGCVVEAAEMVLVDKLPCEGSSEARASAMLTAALAEETRRFDAETLAALDRDLLGVETGTPVLRRDEHGWWLSVEGCPRVLHFRLDGYDGHDPMLARLAMWRWKREEMWQEARRKQSRARMDALRERAGLPPAGGGA